MWRRFPADGCGYRPGVAQQRLRLRHQRVARLIEGNAAARLYGVVARAGEEGENRLSAAGTGQSGEHHHRHALVQSPDPLYRLYPGELGHLHVEDYQVWTHPLELGNGHLPVLGGKDRFELGLGLEPLGQLGPHYRRVVGYQDLRHLRWPSRTGRRHPGREGEAARWRYEEPSGLARLRADPESPEPVRSRRLQR